MTKPSASTILNKSPQKVRLMINPIRGKKLADSLLILEYMKKGKTKKVYNLLLTAAHNEGITPDDYSSCLVKYIVAEEAQTMYRIRPRARGSAFKIRKRYSRIKVFLERV